MTVNENGHRFSEHLRYEQAKLEVVIARRIPLLVRLPDSLLRRGNLLNFTIPVFKWPLPSNHIEIQFFEPLRRKEHKETRRDFHSNPEIASAQAILLHQGH